MRILYSPQRNDIKINYSFEGEKIIVEYNGQTDTFDFSTMPDGKMETHDEFGKSAITTVLPVIPIISAERVEGQLSVVLLNFISENARDSEKYPDWVVV